MKKIICSFCLLLICLSTYAARPGYVWQCVGVQEVNDMGVPIRFEDRRCSWVRILDAKAWADELDLQNFLDTHFIWGGFTPGAMPDPFPAWYQDATEEDRCPIGKICIIETSPFGRDDVGVACSLTMSGGGTTNGVLGFGGVTGKSIDCLSDYDGDGIPNLQDDCPHDATNTDLSCMDDLPNCDAGIAWILSTVGGVSALMGMGATGILTTATMASGVVVFLATGSAVGMVVVAVGGAYCAIAYYEG